MKIIVTGAVKRMVTSADASVGKVVTNAHVHTKVDGVLLSHRLLMAMPSRDDSPHCTRRCLQTARHL